MSVSLRKNEICLVFNRGKIQYLTEGKFNIRMSKNLNLMADHFCDGETTKPILQKVTNLYIQDIYTYKIFLFTKRKPIHKAVAMFRVPAAVLITALTGTTG